MKQKSLPPLIENLQYHIVYALISFLGALPFSILYFLSDLLAGVLHSVVRYRRKVVNGNLASSFPEMDDKERARIERKFYKFLCDYAFETAKMLHLSNDDIKRHMHVENADVINESLQRGRSVTLLLGHYCNWEWVSSLPLHFLPDSIGAQVYHRLHSQAMDRVFMKIRTRFGAHNIAMDDIMRRLVEWKRSGQVSVTGFIADQEPKGLEIHRYLEFLNHESGVFTGPERIARFLDSEVYYCHLSRPKRGEYSLRFVKITDTPKKESTFAITDRYFALLEDNIREAPQYWLWSHKRWKRPRSMFEARWGDRAAEMLSHL